MSSVPTIFRRTTAYRRYICLYVLLLGAVWLTMVLSLDGFKCVDVGLAPIESTGLECLKIWHFYMI